MQLRNRFVLSSAMLVASAVGLPATAFAQHVHGDDHATAVETPASGQRWASDAPLRKGMTDIRAAVEALDHYEHGHMNADQALAAVATVERSIGYIVANCKLEPEADAALHGIIGKLGRGITALKAAPADMSAIVPMREAVQDYGRLFSVPD